MTKSHRDLVCFTDFQELVYRHSFGEITSKYDPIIITEEYAEIAQGNKDSLIQEIIEKDEIPIFKEYRWYKNSQEVDAIVPKSLILSFLFCFDQFLQSHCQTIGKSIASKCSVETFLDEYNARWYSFTSLIQIFEVELQVIVDIVNEACKHPLISVDLIYPGYSQPTKFSIMRMMCRSWGKYVMKSVYEMFMTKITCLIVDYQKKLISLIHEYDELKSTKKYFDNFIDNEYTFSQTSNDVLRHSMLCILDLSIHECNVRLLDNSTLQVDTFYSQIEDNIIKQSKAFIRELCGCRSLEDAKTNNILNSDHSSSESTLKHPETLKRVADIFVENLCRPMIKRTRRRIQNVVYQTICRCIENKIAKMYTSYTLKKCLPEDSIIEADDEEDKAQPAPQVKIASSAKIIKGNEAERICTLIHGIVKKSSFRMKKSGSVIKTPRVRLIENLTNENCEKRKICPPYCAESCCVKNYGDNVKEVNNNDELKAKESKSKEFDRKFRKYSDSNDTSKEFSKAFNTPTSESSHFYNKELAINFYCDVIAADSFGFSNSNKTMIDLLTETYKQLKETEFEYEKADKKDEALHSYQTLTLCGEIEGEDSNINLVRRKKTEYLVYYKEDVDFTDSYYESFKNLDSELFDLLDEELLGDDDEFDFDEDF